MDMIHVLTHLNLKPSVFRLTADKPLTFSDPLFHSPSPASKALLTCDMSIAHSLGFGHFTFGQSQRRSHTCVLSGERRRDQLHNLLSFFFLSEKR